MMMRPKIGAIALILAVTACNSTSVPPPLPTSRDQAAAVLFSVNSVAPWSQVSDAMAPNFSLKGDDAAAKVFQATQRIQDQVLNAVGVGLGLGLPQTSTSGTITHNSTAGTTGNIVNTIAAGVPATVPTTVPTGATLPNPAQAIPTTGDVAVDPVLQYQAARNLFEAVQLMNREVQTVATISCYVPFMVMTKLAVMPYRSDLPFSLQARISFYPKDEPPLIGKAKLGAADIVSHLRQSANSRVRDACDQPTWLPRVVPVLAADDIERAIRSDTKEVARQIGLAVAAMVHGVGANLSANDVNQSVHALTGSAFNNRLQIAREADNTLNVRINPTDQASGEGSGGALVGQSYDIALLLLVPRAFLPDSYDANTAYQNPPFIQVLTQTEFHKADGVSKLDDRSQDAFVATLDGIVKDALGEAGMQGLNQQWLALPKASRQAIGRALLYLVRRSAGDQLKMILRGENCPHLDITDNLIPDPNVDPNSCLPPALWLDPVAQGFLSQVTATLRQGPKNSYGDEWLFPVLWTGASKLIADEPIQDALFEVPVPQPLFIPAQSALLADDGKGGAQLVLNGVTGSPPLPILATLALDKTDSRPAASLLAPAAYALPAGSTAGTLTAVFPAIAAAGLTPASAPTKVGTVTLSVDCHLMPAMCPAVAQPATGFTAFLSTKAQSAPNAQATGFTVGTNVSQITPIADGTGSVALIFTNFTDAQATVTASGGPTVTKVNDLLTAGSPALPASGGMVTIAKPASGNGTYSVALSGLQAVPSVKLTVQGQDGSGKNTATAATLGFTVAH